MEIAADGLHEPIRAELSVEEPDDYAPLTPEYVHGGVVRFALIADSGRSSSVWRVICGKDESVWIESGDNHWHKISIHVATGRCFHGVKSEHKGVLEGFARRSFDTWDLRPGRARGWFHAADVILSGSEAREGLRPPKSWPGPEQSIIALASPGRDHCLQVTTWILRSDAHEEVIPRALLVARMRLSYRYTVVIIARAIPRPNALYERLAASLSREPDQHYGASESMLQRGRERGSGRFGFHFGLDESTGFRGFVEVAKLPLGRAYS